ncbi:hypothetical protein DFH09DRAFT_1070216 [Mycena vulgaris]|nr:hypothetical protein DFH09DRAFT_1070216 [Mycena vulgaris]
MRDAIRSPRNRDRCRPNLDEMKLRTKEAEILKYSGLATACSGAGRFPDVGFGFRTRLWTRDASFGLGMRVSDSGYGFRTRVSASVLRFPKCGGAFSYESFQPTKLFRLLLVVVLARPPVGLGAAPENPPVLPSALPQPSIPTSPGPPGEEAERKKEELIEGIVLALVSAYWSGEGTLDRSNNLSARRGNDVTSNFNHAASGLELPAPYNQSSRRSMCHAEPYVRSRKEQSTTFIWYTSNIRANATGEGVESSNTRGPRGSTVETVVADTRCVRESEGGMSALYIRRFPEYRMASRAAVGDLKHTRIFNAQNPDGFGGAEPRRDWWIIKPCAAGPAALMGGKSDSIGTYQTLSLSIGSALLLLVSAWAGTAFAGSSSISHQFLVAVAAG